MLSSPDVPSASSNAFARYIFDLFESVLVHLAQASAGGCNERLSQNIAPHAGVALSVFGWALLNVVIA